MKHYFVVNPTAGKVCPVEFINKEVPQVLKSKEEYEIYVTKSKEDTGNYVKSICDNLTEQAIFYSCGGDGTCFDILNAMIDCPNAALAIVPVGSCNDFLKSYPEYEFINMDKLVNGTFTEVDVIKANDKYAINVVNAGFDARVNDDVCKMRLKHVDVKKAYSKSVIKNIFHKLSDKVSIRIDDNEIYKGKSTLMAFGNGGFYGGGYNCAPMALMDDGLIECIIVKKISLLTFARLIGKYKKGEHINNPKYKKILTYKQAKKITIDANQDLCFCLDGETYWSKHFELEIIPKKIKFLLPRK